MTAIAPGQSKITYTSASVDWELFHRQFDEALARARGQLGRDYPLYIAGEAVPSPAPPIVDRSPIDTAVVLGRFAAATPAQVDRSEEHTSELQSHSDLVCRLLLEKKKNKYTKSHTRHEYSTASALS